ncbi:hypothetical protein PCE1_004607 [Barthelona sp. PCE]
MQNERLKSLLDLFRTEIEQVLTFGEETFDINVENSSFFDKFFVFSVYDPDSMMKELFLLGYYNENISSTIISEFLLIQPSLAHYLCTYDEDACVFMKLHPGIISELPVERCFRPRSDRKGM